jgi:hypothetical protein
MPSYLGPRSPRTLLGLEKNFSGHLDLQMKVIFYFENSVDSHKSPNHNNPEHHSENLKPHIIVSEDIFGAFDSVGL